MSWEGLEHKGGPLWGAGNIVDNQALSVRVFGSSVALILLVSVLCLLVQARDILSRQIKMPARFVTFECVEKPHQGRHLVYFYIMQMSNGMEE